MGHEWSFKFGGAMKKSASSAVLSSTAPSGLSLDDAVEVRPDKKGPKSLALRRKFGLQGVNALNVDTAPDRVYRRIQKCETVKNHYTFGRQVMPSCHKGMEIVFAKQLSTGNEVVVKIRHKEKSFSSKGSESEWRESTEFVMNLPTCEGIAQIYEVLEDDKGYYVIMEKVQGHDLFEILRMQGLLPMAEVKEVMRQLLTAVGIMHEKGAIHKDLKLENVMFIRSPMPGRKQAESVPCSPVSVKLIDFDTVEEHLPATPKTAKDVMGTDQYIAQEAYSGQYGFASDIFAVGVIGFKLMTGDFPFKKELFNDEAGENYVGHPKMKEIRKKLCEFKIDYSHKNFAKEPEGRQLIQWMLSVKETQRPSAEEALSHPFLAEPKLPGPPQLPKCHSSGQMSSSQGFQLAPSLTRPSSSASLARPSSSGRRNRTDPGTPVKVVKAVDTYKTLAPMPNDKLEGQRDKSVITVRRESVKDLTLRLAHSKGLTPIHSCPQSPLSRPGTAAQLTFG